MLNNGRKLPLLILITMRRSHLPSLLLTIKKNYTL
ncbi:Uncharacterised protein [Vibrio cholerae]|nr:Uncharacterised protein [Vibrio cholerae]